jgi:hypothetical protein
MTNYIWTRMNEAIVRYRKDIRASLEHPVRLCEYVGADFPIDPMENVSGIPLKHLIYGCEYVKRNGQTVRRAPTKHLMGMAMYLNDSFNASPTVQLLVVKDKPELWQVCTVKAGDQATMEYGGPYWQLFSSHLTLWTGIPQQYTVTVLIEDSALRYTSWFRAGSLQNSRTVAPPAAKVSRPPVPSPDIRRHMVSMQSNSKGTTLVSPRVDSIGKVKTKEKREQLLDIDRTSTVPSYSSTNWLSQLANKAPKNTAGHKAKKARKMHEISGMPDNGRNYDLSTRVRDRLKSSSTDGRSLSCSSSDDTLYGGDRPQERARK